MIKPEDVPAIVADAASDAYDTGEMTWQQIVAAALNAWPGMVTKEPYEPGLWPWHEIKVCNRPAGER